MLNDALADSARTLLGEAPCSVILPAGHGKTELVAAAGAVAQDLKYRLLILTHTHAGVDAIRRRLRVFGVRSARVFTIDSWVKSLAESFPGLAGYDVVDDVEWPAVRAAAARLLVNDHLKAVLAASYSHVIIDEYQDCDIAQHELAMIINEVVPVIILGDPLQAIYRFGGNELISWDAALHDFPALQFPVYPWRWHQKNEALGAFLTDVRTRLERGQPIQLNNGSPVRWFEDTQQNRITACKSALGLSGDVVALRRMPNELPPLAKNLGGSFGLMEELEAKILQKLATDLVATTGVARAVILMKFARECYTKLPQTLTAKLNAMEAGTFPSFQPTSQIGDLLTQLTSVTVGPLSPVAVERSLFAVEALGGTLIRREAWHDMKRAAKSWREGSAPTLPDAVRAVRNRSRILGRRRERRVVSRVVLVKGQQFENCVVVGADGLSKCELYVAMTRPTHSLIVTSATRILTPTG